ncbi:MMPL family transporter [Caldiplasma sukawensis]
MFENFFESLGKKVSKHSGKIIVVWIIILVLMSFGSLLVFSHTNFNIANGFGTSNSMSAKASNELSEYFSNSSLNSGSISGSEIIIITQNTSINSKTDFPQLVKYQYQTQSILSKYSCYNGTQNIVDTEKDALLAFSNGMKLIMSTNAQVLGNAATLVSTINSTSSFFPGIEILYGNYFLKFFTHNNNVSSSMTFAFNNTAEFLNEEYHFTNNTHLYYSQENFITVINSTVKPYFESDLSLGKNFTKEIFKSIQTASENALQNKSFVNNLTLLGSSYTNITSFIIEQQNISAFISNFSAESINLTLPIFISQAGSQATSFIVNVDGMSVHNFLNITYNYLVKGRTGIVSGLTSIEEENPALLLTESAAKKQFYGNPDIEINSPDLLNFFSIIHNVSGSKNINNTVYEMMNTSSLNNFPLVPTPFLLHNFVGYDNSTIIFIYLFSENYSNSIKNNITTIVHLYENKITGSKFIIAGSQEFSSQLENEITSGLFKALAAGIILSIIIVGLYFRSFRAAFIPIMMFVVAAIISLGVVGYLYTYVFNTSVSFITPTLLFIFILGLSSDYTVYLMARYRRELRNKTEHPTILTSRWAGHAIFTSGLTVIISEVVLWLANIPFFSDTGLANAIGVTVTLMLATTFLMAILHRFGKKIFPRSASGDFKAPDQRRMEKVGNFSVDHKKILLVVFVIITIGGLFVYASTTQGIDLLKLLPKSQAIEGIEVVNNSFNGDFFDRDFIIVNFTSPLISNGVVNTNEMKQLYNLENVTAQTHGITTVIGPGRPYGYFTGLIPSNATPSNARMYYNTSLSFISSSNSRYVELVIQTYELGWNSKSINTLNVLYKNIENNKSADETVVIGGLTEALGNAFTQTQNSFYELLPILTITIFVILTIQLSSILTPLRLIFMVLAMVLISLMVTYGLFHYLQGYPVVIFMPVFVFVTLLAVGLDYDIFMITRVREEVIKGRTLREGLVTSVKENGSVIMLLGTLLFVTFAALYFSAIPLIQEIGVGVGIGVLLDTFISWPFFIPAIMSIIKRFNWWPSKLEKNEK